MRNSILNISLFIITLFLFNSCSEKGCLDTDSVNFDVKANKNDGVCSYRFLSRIQVNKVRELKSGAENWDTGDEIDRNGTEKNPDLRFYLKKIGSGDWELITDLKTECCTTFPVSWKVVQNDYLRTNEEYEFKLVDEDVVGQELILAGKFTPYWDYDSKTKKIILSNEYQTVVMELIYEIY